MNLHVKCRECNAVVEYSNNNYYPRCDRCRRDMSLIENQIAALFFTYQQQNHTINILNEEPVSNLSDSETPDVDLSVEAALASMVDIVLDFNAEYENNNDEAKVDVLEPQSNPESKAIIEQLKRDGNIYRRDKFSCAICMIENNDTVSTWGECLHSFHTECTIKYHQLTRDSTVPCPLCRHKVAKLC